ncbi:Chromosomal replication initiator protein DnaA [Roseimaritima ulvae]|uniref:Chromosomal replication initiator protein DnaA n=2 Tax=Roseimaritima ulvae TaxID=980254 RepID=A0A5B9QRK6_9BACT|nr:Chromosomal replication initiator protein DnaA [Roseimaritima ulvae]
MDVAEELKDALRQRMGADRYALWFGQGVALQADTGGVIVTADNSFAADRLRARHFADLRAAARAVCGPEADVKIVCAEPAAAPGVSPAQAGSQPDNSDPGNSDPGTFNPGDSDPGDSDSTYTQTDGPHFGPTVAGGSHRQPGRAAEATVQAECLPAFGEPAAMSEAQPRGARRTRGGPRTLSMPSNAGGKAPAARSAAEQTGQAAATTRWAMSLSRFVVGESNELAHTATRMIVEQPGSASPVFFWGPSGTGKTHLLTGVRDCLRRKHRLPRVIQLTAEDFTNDFTTALRGSGLPAFRRRYRDVDALLVDDVQFFGGNKRATLRELLHTVDALLRTRKQLVFAADRPPMEIDGLPAELAGRLSGGMMCSIRPLDVASRRAVLQQFAAMVGLELPETLLTPLSEAATGDGRVLSGLVNQIRAYAQMRGQLPSWQQVLDSAAGELLRSAAPIIGMGDIQKAVCDAFGLPSGTLQSRGQQRSVSQPRMLAMYLARQYTRAAYSEIGGYFGNRSHSTVIAATKRVEGWLSPETGAAGETPEAMRIRQAAAAIENMLRTG